MGVLVKGSVFAMLWPDKAGNKTGKSGAEREKADTAIKADQNGNSGS